MAKKRANGEGSICKRSDGHWEGRYTAGYGPKTGKRINKNVLGRTQVEVREKLKAAIAECQGLDVSREADEYTVATWLRTCGMSSMLSPVSELPPPTATSSSSKSTPFLESLTSS